MIDKDTTFVLGAQDPEMREIERVVQSAGLARAHAAHAGRRCTPQTAYAAQGVVLLGADAVARPVLLPPRAPAVFVECRLRGIEPVAVVDHHHPGDPGWACRPSVTWKAHPSGRCCGCSSVTPTRRSACWRPATIA